MCQSSGLAAPRPLRFLLVRTAHRCTAPLHSSLPHTTQAEDDEFASMVVCAMLKQIEAEYSCATNGEDCVALWDGQSDSAQFDVVRRLLLPRATFTLQCCPCLTSMPRRATVSISICYAPPLRSCG